MEANGGGGPTFEGLPTLQMQVGAQCQGMRPQGMFLPLWAMGDQAAGGAKGWTLQPAAPMQRMGFHCGAQSGAG